jgi:mRNA interferase MazF
MVFPLTSSRGVKQRPALVLLDGGDQDIVVARITSQPARTSSDIVLVEWHLAGLLRPSIVRVDKVATLEKRLVKQRLGILSTNDWANVRAAVHALWTSI